MAQFDVEKLKKYQLGERVETVALFFCGNGKKKAGKPVPVIVDGKPDPRAFKAYLKSK